jgi:surface polysaccharide O-acyltransferase-like enzyme
MEHSMDTSIPTDEERKRLLKMVEFNKHLPIYTICLVIMIGVVDFFFKDSPITGSILLLMLTLGMIFLLLNFAILKRCPRCASWGTPVSRGHCPKCGLRLDPTCKSK